MMKKVLLLTLVLTLVATSFVFADDSQSAISKVTGLTDEEILSLRQSRVGYGKLLTASVVAKMTNTNIKDVLTANQKGTSFLDIAKEKDITIEQYQNAMLEGKLAYVDEQLKAGLITEDQAKLIKERLKTNIENCNGQGFMNGFGQGNRGNGMKGNGFGRNGFRSGNCVFQQ